MERALCGPWPSTRAVSDQSVQEAVRVGRKKLEALIKEHNRSVPWQKAALYGRFLWSPVAVLAFAFCYYLLSVRDVCYPRPLLEPQAWTEEYRRANTFDDWSAKMMQRAEAATHEVHLEYAVVADLGPTYTNRYRDCLNTRRSKHECKKRHLTNLYVIQPAGFQKAVMLAHVKHDAKLKGKATCEFRRVSPLLQSLEVKKAMRKRKDVSSIDRSASSSSQTGDRYHFNKDSQVLLPMAVDLVDNDIDMPLSCIGVVVGDYGMIPLAVAVLMLAWRIRAVKKQGELPGAVTLEQVLSQLATSYMAVFDKAWNMQHVSSLILEDIGLSQKLGVLEEDDKALLSQNYIFCANGDAEFFAGGVHVKTSCDKRPHPFMTSKSRWVVTDGLTGGIGLIKSKKVRGLLRERVKDLTWKDFQVLRQVDLRLFKCASDGGVLRIDPVTFFPHQLKDRDWQLLRETSTNLVELFKSAPLGEAPCSADEVPAPPVLTRSASRGVSSETVEVSETLREIGPVLLSRTISRTGSSQEVCPKCVVTGEDAPLFALVERQVYSWHALRAFIVDRGARQRSDEAVAFGPGQRDVSFLQRDPMNRFIHKSARVDFGVSVGGGCLDAPDPQVLQMMQAAMQHAQMIHLQRQVWLQPHWFQGLDRQVQEARAAAPQQEEEER